MYGIGDTERIERTEPGCERRCPRCTVSCAAATGARDDLWREAERLRCEISLHPTWGRATDLSAVLELLAGAERVLARVRPRDPGDRPYLAWSETFLSARVH